MSFLRFWNKVVGYRNNILTVVNVFRRVKSKKQKSLGKIWRFDSEMNLFSKRKIKD